MLNIEKIIKPYLSDIKYSDYSKLESDDFRLIKKWQHRIPKGWYGFDGINTLWGKIIDEVLVELEKIAPEFEIHQIKLKFGGLRFYVHTGIQDPELYKIVENQLCLLESALFNTNLIY